MKCVQDCVMRKKDLKIKGKLIGILDVDYSVRTTKLFIKCVCHCENLDDSIINIELDNDKIFWWNDPESSAKYLVYLTNDEREKISSFLERVLS